MPGSVMAIAVIELARADARQPARLLLVGAVASRKYGRQMSLWSVMPEPGAADAGPLDLLADDEVVAEVVDPAAAVAPRARPCPRKPCSPAWRNSVAGDDAGRAPTRRWCGHDLLVDELPDSWRGTCSCSSSNRVRSMGFETTGWCSRPRRGDGARRGGPSVRGAQLPDWRRSWTTPRPSSPAPIPAPRGPPASWAPPYDPYAWGAPGGPLPEPSPAWMELPPDRPVRWGIGDLIAGLAVWFVASIVFVIPGIVFSNRWARSPASGRSSPSPVPGPA